MLADDRYDRVIISTLPRRVSKWLRRDLPRRVESLSVPVEVITPKRERVLAMINDYKAGPDGLPPAGLG